jgi:hypothetical protein
MVEDKLRVQIDEEMLNAAFKFGNDYFQNPAKTLKDRTGEKSRGFGQIVTANLYGKLTEIGVAKIIGNLSGKTLKIDMKVEAEFDFTKPDVDTVVDADGTERDPNKFLEIKFSPGNFEWIGLYLTQMNKMREHAEGIFSQSQDTDDEIILINANIVNKKTGEDLLDQPSLDAIEKNEREVEKLKEDLDKLPRTLSEQTAPQYFPGMSLNDARSKLRLQKKDIRDEMKEKNQLIKNLKIAVPNRKQDLLGVFLKYLTKEKHFDFFDELKNFEVVIQYSTTVSELIEHGREFSRKEDENGKKIKTHQPASEIFYGKGEKQKSYEDDNITGTDFQIIPADKIEQFTIVPVELITRDMEFPEQFGGVYCDGDVEVIQETTETGVQLYLKCKSDVHVWSDFLGYWDFKTGEIWKIQVKKQYEKNRDDQFLPKRILDQSVFQKTSLLDRMKEIAKKI